MNNRNNNKDKNPVVKFNKITIGLASPESILAESRGEVLKPETINYKGFRMCLWKIQKNSLQRDSL
jgi:DNA-directed RNA polymerase subunit beta'